MAQCMALTQSAVKELTRTKLAKAMNFHVADVLFGVVHKGRP